MKASITILIFFSSLSFAFSQTNLDKAFSAFNLYYKQNPVDNTPRENLLLNKSEKIIDLGEVQMPINQVAATYHYYSQFNYHHSVLFSCTPDGPCFIVNGSDYKDSVLGTHGFGIAFKTKEMCYKWIELFSKLKEEINKKQPN
jgi:hypothetical protein